MSSDALKIGALKIGALKIGSVEHAQKCRAPFHSAHPAFTQSPLCLGRANKDLATQIGASRIVQVNLSQVQKSFCTGVARNLSAEGTGYPLGNRAKPVALCSWVNQSQVATESNLCDPNRVWPSGPVAQWLAEVIATSDRKL